MYREAAWKKKVIFKRVKISPLYFDESLHKYKTLSPDASKEIANKQNTNIVSHKMVSSNLLL